MMRKQDHIVDTLAFVMGQATVLEDEAGLLKPVFKVSHLLLQAWNAEVDGRHNVAVGTVERALVAVKRIKAAQETDRRRLTLIEASMSDLLRRLTGCQSGKCLT